VLGTKDLLAYLEKFQIKLDSHFDGILGDFPKKPLQKFITNDNKHLCSNEALDFLSKCLVYDHTERILPKEAILHPYF